MILPSRCDVTPIEATAATAVTPVSRRVGVGVAGFDTDVAVSGLQASARFSRNTARRNSVSPAAASTTPTVLAAQ